MGLPTFSSLIKWIGTVLVIGGVLLCLAGPVALLLGRGFESGFRFLWGSVLYVLAGAILLPQTYEPISIPGFSSRPKRAPFLSFILVVFGTALLP